MLFGDGAAAVVCEPYTGADGRGLLSTHLWADGRFVEELWQPYPTVKDKAYIHQGLIDNKLAVPHMDGKRVFVHASERMPEAVMTALSANGLTIADVALLIPHQANDRISQMVAKKLQIPLEKVFRNIERYGNTTAASIPLALDEAVREGRLKPGDILVPDRLRLGLYLGFGRDPLVSPDDGVGLFSGTIIAVLSSVNEDSALRERSPRLWPAGPSPVNCNPFAIYARMPRILEVIGPASIFTRMRRRP